MGYRRTGLALGAGLALCLAPAPALADIAVLSNGQTLKVSGFRVEGEVAWLALKTGGEMGVPLHDVRGLMPDEVMDEVLSEVRGARNETELEQLARAAAQRHGLDPDLVLAVVAVESGFQPRAISPKGAQGLMQLMPPTARELGVTNAFDPAQNLDGGSRHLSALIARYGGDLTKALAAYNAGQGAVDRHRGIPPYRETRDYVKRVLRKRDAAKEREKKSASSSSEAASKDAGPR
jgi:soluble lytic murein transglycosylase-like protein